MFLVQQFHTPEIVLECHQGHATEKGCGREVKCFPAGTIRIKYHRYDPLSLRELLPLPALANDCDCRR